MHFPRHYHTRTVSVRVLHLGQKCNQVLIVAGQKHVEKHVEARARRFSLRTDSDGSDLRKDMVQQLMPRWCAVAADVAVRAAPSAADGEAMHDGSDDNYSVSSCVAVRRCRSAHTSLLEKISRQPTTPASVSDGIAALAEALSSLHVGRGDSVVSTRGQRRHHPFQCGPHQPNDAGDNDACVSDGLGPLADLHEQFREHQQELSVTRCLQFPELGSSRCLQRPIEECCENHHTVLVLDWTAQCVHTQPRQALAELVNVQ